MEYRAEASTLEGFVQQLAVCYVARGYWFYVSGVVPPHKDPRRLDAKLIEHYRITSSKFERARRKASGLANVQYIRFGDRFFLLATAGEHRFFREEPGILDCREVPLKFGGYAIGYRGGHAQVRIKRGRGSGCGLITWTSRQSVPWVGSRRNSGVGRTSRTRRSGSRPLSS